MKIALASDVHLEYGQFNIKNTKKADVLILSGDILVASKLGRVDHTIKLPGEGTQSDRYHKFMAQACKEFPQVVYVMGNHEHYEGDYQQSANIIRDAFSYLNNLHFLEKETFVLDNFTFIGGTLWTDFNRCDPRTMLVVKREMNDYYIIENGSSKLTPEDTYQDHKDMLTFIDKTIQQNPDNKYIVVGHHAPSNKSINSMYVGHYETNGAYASVLDEFIMDRPQIKLWTHGHTHFPFDYKIGKTRVICNPRGYIGYELAASKFEVKYITVK